jgi:hypothetical protein
MEAWSLHMIALAAASQRKFDEARVQAHEALRRFYEAGDVAGVTLVIDDLAIVAVGDGDQARGGRLWGAARHLQQATGTGLADYVEQNFEMFGVPSPNQVLAPKDLETLAVEGAAMSLDDLVAYALGIEEGVVTRGHPGIDQ